MIQVTGLKAIPFQTFRIANPNGTGTIIISLSYRPRVQAWFIDVEFGEFILRGTKLVRGLNLLNHYRKNIDFGITISVTDQAEPFLINDFSVERVTMYILDSTDVLRIDELILSGAFD